MVASNNRRASTPRYLYVAAPQSSRAGHSLPAF